MPGCGSGVLVSSSSLLIRSHHGRCQAKIPLSPPFKFAEPPLNDESHAKCLRQSAKIFVNVHVIALNIVELALFAMAHTAKTQICRSF
jgi:hypothetical protein